MVEFPRDCGMAKTCITKKLELSKFSLNVLAHLIINRGDICVEIVYSVLKHINTTTIS